MIKDTSYWKEYNQKRKEYIQQKNKERYLKGKGINTTSNIHTTKLIQPNEAIQINTTFSNNTTTKIIQPINTTEKELIQPKKVVDKNKNMSTTKNPVYNRPKKLWKDFYTGLKPHCPTCLKKGITLEEYAFCSTEKKPIKIYDEQNRVIHTFDNIYTCSVYHWTIFQGQGKIQ